MVTRKKDTPKKSAHPRKTGKRKPKRDRSPVITKPELRIIIFETQNYFFRQVIRMTSRINKEWSPRIARTLNAWRRQQGIESRQHRRKRKPGAIPLLKIGPHQLDDFSESYCGVIDGAAGHFAGLLTQAFSVRQGLGEEAIETIRHWTDEFALHQRKREQVSDWLCMTISHLDDSPKLPGFEALLSRVFESINSSSLWLPTRDRKLRLAVALMGSDRMKTMRQLPGFARTLEELKKMPSSFQAVIAATFGVSTRWVRQWVKEGKLTKSGAGRILPDEKLDAMWKLYHSPLEK